MILLDNSACEVRLGQDELPTGSHPKTTRKLYHLIMQFVSQEYDHIFFLPLSLYMPRFHYLFVTLAIYFYTYFIYGINFCSIHNFIIVLFNISMPSFRSSAYP
jgi:hypothetical protein